jgi:hypothetical protein
MKKRTFFLVSKSPALGVSEKFTCDDVRESLVVEQVDARLTGTDMSIDTLVERFPEAVRAAHYWSVMKSRQKADATLAGPFICITDAEPSDEDLLAWYRTAHGVAPATQPATGSSLLDADFAKQADSQPIIVPAQVMVAARDTATARKKGKRA